MRSARLALVLCFAAAAGGRPAGAVEPPGPAFWPSEVAFLEEVRSGQFNDRLELHLLQYSADPGWSAEWAARKLSSSGLFGEYGSTTGSELYVNGEIALNLFASGALQIRYDRREYREGRFDVSDERFDALWHTGAGWAVILTGWPSFEKEKASFGFGLRLGAPRARNALEVRVVNDRFLWNEKSDGDVRITARPLRLLLEGHHESGSLRLHGSVDWGLPHAAEQRGADGEPPLRTEKGRQRFLDLAAERVVGGGAIGIRLTGAAVDRRQEERTGEAYRLDRRWGRVVLTGRREIGRVTARALLGFASQRDDFSSGSVPSGAYEMDALLFGLEGAMPVARSLELRLGYLGSVQGAERETDGAEALPDLEESPFLDKAHARALYTFRPGMSIELLLSQALRGGSFGGGSVKALLTF